MKFQNPNLNIFEWMHGQMDGGMDGKAQSNMPQQLFKSLGQASR